MGWSMSASSVEQGWQALLRLRDAIDVHEGPASAAYVQLDPARGRKGVTIDRSFSSRRGTGPVVAVLRDSSQPIPASPRADAVFAIEGLVRVRVLRSGDLPMPLLLLFRTYLPYVFASLHARRLGRAFTVSHFAQSLDGRIATLDGDSRNIGSPSNLVHAHRMRALCDAVLIGSRTLRRDKPRLSVRYVEGRQPARVVLASSATGIKELSQTEGGPVYLVGGNGGPAPSGVRMIRFHGDDGSIPTSAILGELMARGVRSVYIEGGALTTSRFLGEGNVDVVQVHIAPVILGSGLVSFRLPPVPDVASSLWLADHSYTPVDDGVMVVGTVAPFGGGSAGDS
ncbi:MAG TPA: RibD family protein [Candidatus Bathyarchaeia archaeon]|nr:RibD family protein [Candidatus Bathyarchaeia archaeon]